MGRILKIKRDTGKNFEDQKRYWEEFWRSKDILSRILEILKDLGKNIEYLDKNFENLDKNFEDP